MPTASDQIRAFIAIELPAEVKAFLEVVVTDLKKIAADVKWIRPEGIHLTLKFFGNISGSLISELQTQLGPQIASQETIEVQVRRLGGFPSLIRPRVIWAGLNDREDALVQLAQEIDDLSIPLGFQREKRAFTPHLTLGRVKSNKRLTDLVEEIRQKMDIVGPSFSADHAVLFQSILKPSGAEYHPLVRFPFASPASI